MPFAVVPHLNFRGQAREALGFYQSVFGGELTIMSYGDAHSAEDAAQPDHVIWGQVATNDGFRIMAYDVQAKLAWSPGENPFYVSLSSPTEADIKGRWERLSEGAAILHPLSPMGWAPLYGKLTDRFGVTWIVAVEPSPPPGH